MPMKALSFKGDKKPKKRKHRPNEDTYDDHLNSLHADSASVTTVTQAKSSDDDTWAFPDAPSDLTGPVILLLPTTPPTCLAADAHGNVFCLATGEYRGSGARDGGTA